MHETGALILREKKTKAKVGVIINSRKLLQGLSKN